ncbi:MAG: tetratricopeptide repeat protein [Phenylobacterium sp.]|uniref:tetratricopeptide repeat protein n=1 Tax=Phenylobacterium sp. TaxID=1871053 RepID=UPI001A50E865|nr:tetratricopeptide repeat protein [Phenylobacterium sp.]MBL8555391.1 tetratricopeptide repeat protein [Phenylobacterium sp.]
MKTFKAFAAPLLAASVLAAGVPAPAAAAGAGAATAQPVDLEDRLDLLAHGWDHVNYEVHGAARADAAAALAAQADAVARRYPGRAEPLVWKAIALSTEAGAKGGLGGLSLAKDARAVLEQAERLNPNALGDGSVYTSLGSLYYQVPGFPVGFGDRNKAQAYLRKALAQNPAGLDPNYFYGDFLFRQGQYAEAEKALQRALAAPARPGREIADRGRRAEAAALLAQVRAKRG